MEEVNRSTENTAIGSQCSRPIIITGETIQKIQTFDSYKKEDPNKIIKEKSDSNIPFLENNEELKNCKTNEEKINVLKGFMEQGFNDFEKRTGHKPSYSEIRAMYG